MNVFPVKWLSALAALTILPMFLLVVAAAQTQLQKTEAEELPSITVGPAPASKSPTIIKAPDTAAPPQRRLGTRPKTLQLRLDPKTGQALTPQQLEDRARRRVQAPRSLRPRQSAQPATPPPPGDRATSAGNDSGKVNEATGTRGEGIQVQNLGQAKVSAIGLLNAAQGGLGQDMWAGTRLPLVMALLPRLPAAASSPAMQSLRRRLLVSTALPPADDASAADAGDQDGSALAAARIERLAAAGDSDAVARLLKFAPLTMENAVYARVQVEAELLNGNVREACRMARNFFSGDNVSGPTTDDQAIWQKVMAFCLALDGQAAQVELYEQLLYENGIDDEAYFTLLSGLSGGEVEPLDKIARTGPLHLAMLRAARRAIPADAVKGAAPAVVRAIATSPNASLSLRLEAAERAEAMGILGTEILARVYASVPFSAEQAADAIALAEQQPGPSAAAILYQVARIDDQISGRARALAAAWRNGRRSGRYMTAVRVNLSQTRTIQPDPALAWFAAPAGRALLAAGDRDAARAWLLAVIEPARGGQKDAAAAMLTLAPLLYVDAGAAEDRVLASVMGKVLAGWWQGEVANGGPERYQRAIRLFGLLSALGRDVSGDLWLPLLAAPEREVLQSRQPTSAPLLIGLDRAAAAGRRGEAVLLSLLLLGDEGPGQGDSMTLGRIVSALRQVGLADDAGAVALEGLLGVGF
ncbi:MAG: hypothetical protein HOK30_26060 [Rhodospirillaceae bacterium]|jgi:hypothetical protein|nr:hypothetical protein [Rhodospirillaceae bacterium]MBT5193960.1 hypothetical protein [Rhodospirillaceae bacterium]MBT5897833.1 hypothetical protein [Rhodospirillaceae bacterium]MBT6431158.1 hypothetical protein [Rhodospirillaceae bacterium]